MTTTTTIISTSTSIGGLTDGGGLFPTFVPSDVAGQTVLGCPISSFMSLDAKCPITGSGLPACATQTADFDEPCCGSLSAFATSVGECYSSNAPACLNLDELSSSLTAFSATATDQQVTNPCARFASTTTTGDPTETGGQAAQTGKTGGSGTTGGSTPTGTATDSASAASSTDSSSGSVKERGNMGLKMIATLALLGSLGVLWL